MHLKIGDSAPAFVGKDEQGNTVSLADFKGKKLVLYFYPKDNTPGCTIQACNLRNNYVQLQKAGYEIVGISTDSASSHKKFIAAYQLPFRLLVDDDHVINEMYGTWVKKYLFGRKYFSTARTSFIINESGIIERIIQDVKTSQHANQILEK
jgi:peroxiredoxin Q/BCP